MLCAVVYFQQCTSCFFFQAEDGIRDVAVTGVQTCALPISFGGLLPPLMTGLSSMVSASRTTWSGVISSSPRITRTVSGRMSSSRRTSFTRSPPAISTSRRGFRRMTFIGSPRPSRLRKPGRALDVADLGEMYRVVSSLELPPLREVEIAAVGVLETELARIQRREPLDGLSAPLARGLHGCDQLADHLSG